MVQPLNVFIARIGEDFDDIIPGVAALFESEGSHYALPSEYAGKAVVYNKSYFQQIGLADPNMDRDMDGSARDGPSRKARRTVRGN